MRPTILCSTAALLLLVGSSALADVTVKNKDGRDAQITIRRSNSRMDDVVKAKTSVAFPGAPLTIILKKNNASMEAADGETIVIEKGKLSKIGTDGEAVAPEASPTAAPTSAPEKAPEATPAPEPK